jgi:hypothetical protein
MYTVPTTKANSTNNTAVDTKHLEYRRVLLMLYAIGFHSSGAHPGYSPDSVVSIAECTLTEAISLAEVPTPAVLIFHRLQ